VYGFFYFRRKNIMAELLDYVPSITLGTGVAKITGKSQDGFTAGGFAAFMLSISGENPTVVRLPNNRAQLVLSKKQIAALQKFLDREIGLAVAKPKEPPTLDISLGPALVPWALKYAVPAAVLLIIAGWVGHYYFAR
jgi:hypothetical protein